MLGSFDCLIIDNAATGQLRPEQLEAIQVWVGTGGLLITVGGATWQSTLGPLPPDLLPVEPTGLTSVQTLDAVGQLMEVPLDSPAPWLVSQSRPRVERGARVVANQDGIPLIVASKQGDGTLMYLAFEPTTRNFRSWPGNEAMWRYLLTHAAVDNGVGSALVRPYLRWGGRPPRIAMADFSTHPKPTLDWFWVMASDVRALDLAERCCVLGRRGLVGTSLLAAIGVTGVVTLLGFTVARTRAEPEAGHDARRRGAPHRSWRRLGGVHPRVDLDPGPSRGQVRLPACPTMRSPAGCTTRSRARATSPTLAGHSALVKARSPASTMSRCGRDSSRPPRWTVSCARRLAYRRTCCVERGALTGTVINRTGGRLSDAYLVVDNDIRPLGSLDRDQTQLRWTSCCLQRAAAGNLAAAAFADKLTPTWLVRAARRRRAT